MANAYTQVPHWLITKMYTDERLSGRELRVLLYIIRKTYGFHKKSDKIAYSDVANATGIDRRSVVRVLKSLEGKKWISVQRKKKCVNIIRLLPSGKDATSASGTDGLKLVANLPPSKERTKDAHSGAALCEPSFMRKENIDESENESEDAPYWETEGFDDE